MQRDCVYLRGLDFTAVGIIVAGVLGFEFLLSSAFGALAAAGGAVAPSGGNSSTDGPGGGGGGGGECICTGG